MTRRNLYYNYIGYPNYYEEGGLVGRPNGVQLIPIETKGISPHDAVNNGNAEGGNKFMDFMNSSGGGWANAIAPAATNIANAFLDTEASTADRVAGAMGIAALAKQWTADTTKGDAKLKEMQNNLISSAKPNYIQDASSSWGANNAVKLNNKSIISPISSVSGLPSLKDFKGNWWRNMGASVAQGAASGSVGGPWGALGGAVTGLLGSIGGLFGRAGRAQKAYDDFLAKRRTLMSAQQSAFDKAVKDQTLSNMQALANGNIQQRINDMANIRAYGGNLFDGGGAINIANLFQNAVQKSTFASLYDPYTIKRGETLSGIASKNNISLEDLISANPEIANPSMINVGQQINLPTRFNAEEIADNTSGSFDMPNFSDYTVRKGDYMSKIAKSNNITLEELRKANPQIKDINNIFVGDIIHVPQSTAITAPEPKRMSLAERRAFEEEANKTNLGAIQGYRHDNNYAVIDKKNKTITVYSPTNEILYQSNDINTGLSGDDYNTITYTDKAGKIESGKGNMSTPAGITEINDIGTYHNQPSYTRKRVGDETDIASSFHAGDINKGSNGCVRMSDKTLQDLQQFLNKGTRVYTLPEKDGSKFILKDGKLSFQADNPYGETDGNKKYWDDYNVYNDKTSGDLFISPNENFKEKYKDTEKLGNAIKFGNVLSEGKTELQKRLGLSSGIYNDLAQLAMGIADQETKFGSSNKYSFKSSMPWLVNSAKWITGNNSVNSQGITQIKYDADIRNEDLKRIYDDLGITKESLQTPEGAAKATLARLAFIYKTEILGKKFTGADGIEISPLDALLYKYMGKNNELKNHTATPNLNKYIKNVNTYKNNFDYEGTFAMGGNLYTDLSPNMMNLWNNKQQIDQQKVNMQQMNFGLGNSFNYKNMFPDGGIIPPNRPLTKEEIDRLTPAEREEYAKKQAIRLYKELYAPSPALYDSREEDDEHTYNVLNRPDQNPFSSLNVFANLFKPSNYGYIFSEENKRKEAAEKAQQHSGGSISWGGKLSDEYIDKMINAPDMSWVDYEEEKKTGKKYKESLRNPMPSASLFDKAVDTVLGWLGYGKTNEDKIYDDNSKFYANGGQINSSDLPDNMQYYANGGTHEQNPYGGIQVGVDQQGNPNLVEEGEFRWGDYVFSDRINVDPTLLSRYNLAPATKHQGKKANKGKLSYADMAKKYAKKNGELANDPIGKNTLEAYMKRLQDAQEDQKFQDSMEQQKQDAINQYRNALTTPQQGNPMYGAMKYNGMGNAATQQGVNAGMSDLGQQGGGNEVLSNTNRSGNNMLHAFGGNLFALGGGNEFPDNVLTKAYKKYRESQYPSVKNNEITLKAKPQDFIYWVGEPDKHPVDYEYFLDDDSPTKYVGLSPTGIQPYIHPAASPINIYQYTPYKSRVGSDLPVYAPHSTYAYEFNGEAYEPQYFRHSNRIEDNYIPIEQPWEDNVVIPDRGIQGNRNWIFNDHTLPVYQSNFNSKLDTRPSYIKNNNPNSIAPAVSTYGAEVRGTNNIMYDKFGNNTTLYPNGLNALNNNDYFSQLERDNPTNLIVPSGAGWRLPQDSDNESLNLGIRDGGATTDVINNGGGQNSVSYNVTTNTGRQDLTGNLGGNTGSVNSNNNQTDRTTTTTFGTAATKEDPKQVPHYSTAGEYAMFGKGAVPMLYDWMNKTNTKYDPNQRPAYELADMGNNSTFLRTADTIGGYRAPNLMDAERMNNAAQAQGIAALQAALNVGNGNRGYAAAQTAQNAYNTQMGIGNNYATTQQINNDERFKNDSFNTALDQANANIRNSMYQDNQKGQQIGQQMKIDAKKAANDYILRNELYADATNRQAMENRAANQATWTDNALNYFIAQAQKNDILNAKNNDITNPYWTDKNGVMHYIGDSGLNSAIYDAFTSGDSEWGNYAVNNGTFKEDRLKAWNALQEKYSAADLKAHPELWKSLVLQEKQARKEEAEKAELSKTDRLNNQRYAFDNNMAQLNNYRTLYGDKFTDSQWYDDLMKRYNDAANANEFNDVNNLEYWNRVIGDKLNYWQRYNTPVTANQSAYGGYINNNNKSNKREYYNYMRR